jgi:hypothetical protein
MKVETMSDQFISLAIQYGKSIAIGDNKSANKVHNEIMKLYAEKKQQNRLSELEQLWSHDDINVRLWAATIMHPILRALI